MTVAELVAELLKQDQSKMVFADGEVEAHDILRVEVDSYGYVNVVVGVPDV